MELVVGPPGLAVSVHAAGVRLAYACSPQRVQSWVEHELGSTVTRVVDCVGGMSPGPAARLVTASGRRAFVKAVGSELNPETPALLRLEADALAVLPRHPSLGCTPSTTTATGSRC